MDIYKPIEEIARQYVNDADSEKCRSALKRILCFINTENRAFDLREFKRRGN